MGSFFLSYYILREVVSGIINVLENAGAAMDSVESTPTPGVLITTRYRGIVAWH